MSAINRKVWKLLGTNLYACNCSRQQALDWIDRHLALGILETEYIIPEIYQDTIFSEEAMLRFNET